MGGNSSLRCRLPQMLPRFFFVDLLGEWGHGCLYEKPRSIYSDSADMLYLITQTEIPQIMLLTSDCLQSHTQGEWDH